MGCNCGNKKVGTARSTKSTVRKVGTVKRSTTSTIRRTNTPITRTTKVVPTIKAASRTSSSSGRRSTRAKVLKLK